ncbi:hypothetical protein NHF46_06535 [Arthrobacter alpinus]|nr:hypothetical protein [Arthrobacter alpinus]
MSILANTRAAPRHQQKASAPAGPEPAWPGEGILFEHVKGGRGVLTGGTQVGFYVPRFMGENQRLERPTQSVAQRQPAGQGAAAQLPLEFGAASGHGGLGFGPELIRRKPKAYPEMQQPKADYRDSGGPVAPERRIRRRIAAQVRPGAQDGIEPGGFPAQGLDRELGGLPCTGGYAAPASARASAIPLLPWAMPQSGLPSGPSDSGQQTPMGSASPSW